MIQSRAFWLVLGVSTVVYWLLPTRWRLAFLATTSLGYLASLEPLAVAAVVAWTVLVHRLAPLAARSDRSGTRVGAGLILAILGYLAYFKYLPPLVDALSTTRAERALIVPLGLSYTSFKLIHYVVEVARGKIESRSLSEFACYMLLFPIFTAGPIERFDHFCAHRESRWQVESFVEGSMRIVHGLIKKFFLCGLVLRPLFRGVETSDDLLASLEVYPTWKVWGFCTLSYLTFYLEFSAYSDIAIGASRLFGLQIMENFNFPIIASNASDFWRRWHMTLWSWCQHYVYLPTIAATRNPYLAVYVVFLVIGLWHSGTADRIGWGLYQATGLSVYVLWSRFKRKRKWRTPTRGVRRYVGIPLTQLFVIPSIAFLVVEHKQGLWGAMRILAKLIFVDVAP